MLKLFRNFSIYTGVSLITGSISFLLLPLLTSYLNPEDYGLLSIFNASIRFVSACIGLGMSHILLVDLVNNKDTFGIKLLSFGVVTFTITILLFIVVFLYSFYSATFFGVPIQFTFLIPLISLLVVYFELGIGIMVFLKQVKKFAIFSLSKFGLETILTILFVVVLGMNWTGRITSLILSLIIIVIFLTSYIIKEFDLKQKLLRIKREIARLLVEGGSLFFMAISVMIINLSDRFFIEFFNGIYDTGIYSVAATIASLILMLISALMNAIRPIIYELLKKNNKKKLKNFSIAYHTILLLFSLSLMLFIPFIFKYFIDDKFIEAEHLTFLLIIGLFFWGGYNFYNSYLLYQKKHRYNSFIAVFSIITNLILNYFLIQEYGLNGAAYATLFTYVCMFILSILISLKHKKIKLLCINRFLIKRDK